MNTYFLAYRSRPAFDPDAPAGAAVIDEILRVARQHNAKAGITGGLACTNKFFFQVLEGDTAAIELIGERIFADRRHKDFQVLAKGPISERRFFAWSMAHLRIDHPELDRFDQFLAECDAINKGKIDDLITVMCKAAGKSTVSVTPLFLLYA